MSITYRDRARFARALRSRPFALLWLGQTVSSLGNGAFYTAIAWQVLVLTGSATAMGVVLVAQTLPQLVFLLLGGVLADRLPRRLVMLWSDGGRAVAVLLIAALGWLGVLQLWHLVALALVFGLASAFFLPAYLSISPQLVEVEALPSANALTGMSRQLSTLLGPALGAGCVALAGPATAFAFDGATFIFSALCLLVLRVPTRTAPTAPEGQAQDTTASVGRLGGMLADVREGLGYVLRSPWLWVTIAIASLGNVALAPMQVVLPELVRDVFHAGVWLLGAILIAEAAGGLVAMLLIGQMRHLRHRGIIAYGGLFLTSLGLLVFGLPLPPALAPALALAAGATLGFGLGVFSIIWDTVLQELIPAQKLGRVVSIDMLGSFCLLPLGLALAGVLADHVGVAVVFLGAAVLHIGLNLLGISVRGIRELE